MFAVGPDTLAELEQDIVSIYDGDPVSTYQACNAIQSYGDFAWLPVTKRRVEQNADYWIEYIKRVENANALVDGGTGGGNMTAVISRNLMGLRLGVNEQDNADLWPVYGLSAMPYVMGEARLGGEPEWNLFELREYVYAIIDGLTPAQRNLVAGWWVDDEGTEKADHTTALFIEVVTTVHNAQKDRGVNWPFYWAEETGFLQSEGGDLHMSGGSWTSDLPPKMRDWIEVFFTEADLLDATPVFMPFYYPWASNNWESTPRPYLRWKLLMEDLEDRYPRSTHDRLKIHPVLQASDQASGGVGSMPSHVDMHEQIVAMLDLDRVDGMWFIGWDQTPRPANELDAKRNWTQAGSARWAEAIQNEIGAGTEGLANAIPAATGFDQNFPNPFVNGTHFGIRLSERRNYRVEIRDLAGNVVRNLVPVYDSESPQGQYWWRGKDGWVTATNPPPPGEFYGTAIFWDLTDDFGGQLPVAKYSAYLYVDDPGGETEYGPVELN